MKPLGALRSSGLGGSAPESKIRMGSSVLVSSYTTMRRVPTSTVRRTFWGAIHDRCRLARHPEG